MQDQFFNYTVKSGYSTGNVINVNNHIFALYLNCKRVTKYIYILRIEMQQRLYLIREYWNHSQTEKDLPVKKSVSLSRSCICTWRKTHLFDKQVAAAITTLFASSNLPHDNSISRDTPKMQLCRYLADFHILSRKPRIASFCYILEIRENHWDLFDVNMNIPLPQTLSRYV